MERCDHCLAAPTVIVILVSPLLFPTITIRLLPSFAYVNIPPCESTPILGFHPRAGISFCRNQQPGSVLTCPGTTLERRRIPGWTARLPFPRTWSFHPVSEPVGRPPFSS